MNLIADKLRNISYFLQQDEDSFVYFSDIIDEFAPLKVSFSLTKDFLLEENYIRFISCAIQDICRLWEKIIFSSKFNQKGALILDKNIRSVTSAFSDASSLIVRSLFTRLLQISNALNAETLDDLNALVKEDLLLSQSDLKLISDLRVDLKNLK